MARIRSNGFGGINWRRSSEMSGRKSAHELARRVFHKTVKQKRGRAMPIAKQVSQISIEDVTLSITEEIQVRAPIEKTFESLLAQLGPGNETPDGKFLNMKIEPWPGGRWYRGLGDGN